MKKVIFIRKEIVTDVRWYQAEISTEDFPELLNEDFDINDMSDELYDELGDADWDFVNDKALSPDVEYSIKKQ